MAMARVLARLGEWETAQRVGSLLSIAILRLLAIALALVSMLRHVLCVAHYAATDTCSVSHLVPEWFEWHSTVCRR